MILTVTVPAFGLLNFTGILQVSPTQNQLRQVPESQISWTGVPPPHSVRGTKPPGVHSPDSGAFSRKGGPYSA